MRNRSGDSPKLTVAIDKYQNFLQVLAEVHLDQWLQRRVGPSDIVQETLFEATRDFADFRGTSEPQLFAWLKSILLNNINRAIGLHLGAKKRSLRKEVSLDQLQALQQSSLALENILVSQVSTPSESANHHELLLAVSDCIAELADDHRQIIMLRSLQSKSYHDAAQLMSRSEGACRMLWLRAVDELRQKFSERKLL